MPTYIWTEAAASAAVGDDLAKGKRGQTSPKARVLRGLAFVGSAAAGDCSVDIYAGDTLLGTFWNSSTGTAFDMSKDFVTVGNVMILPNEPLYAIMSDAAATNPVYLHMVLDEVG